MRRPMVFVLLAGLAAMLASVMVYSALKRREADVQRAMAHNVQVVVASYDLPLGSRIELGEVKMARWSADSVPEGSYTDPKQVIGSYVKNSLVANEPIVQAKLFTGDKTAGVMPLLIPFGMRAVSVPVDEVSDIAGFVLPHTRVDVLVAMSGGEGTEKAFSKVVLQNIEVLAVAQEVEQKKDEPTVVKVVTLLVSPQEAERLALASHAGSLRLAMRNYNDNKIVLTNGSDVAQMLRAYTLAPDVPVMAAQPEHHAAVAAAPRRAKAIEVEILRNGKSSESVSFVNEAAADTGSAQKSIRHARKSSSDSADYEATDASADASTSVASAPDADHHDSSAAPATGDIKPPGASSSATSVTYVPTPKTIDIP
jgi:pilus assembly protein CpaB